MIEKINNRNLLCKKMNIYCNRENCDRSHSIDELVISNCIYDEKCKNLEKCPFVHKFDLPINKDEYFKRMFRYINPYSTFKTTICRYSEKGCKIENCRKAHNEKELKITECDCFRENCVFYHKNKDENITKQEYYKRMENWLKIFEKPNKKFLCRYINIGCNRPNCQYAHDIKDLYVHKCIFDDCYSKCVFLHRNETIDKHEYFERMLNFIQPFKENSILCNLKQCNKQKCKYAHNKNELLLTNCNRGSLCKYKNCPFYHPNENFSKDLYYERMILVKYPN